MADRFDGKKLSDLGLSADRISDLQSHVSGAGKDHGKFGYSANTEHHFKELDNPTSSGSIEADMRKIGEHLGYKHAGTLNHDKVRDFIMQQEAAPEAAPEPTERPELSERAGEALAKVKTYEDWMSSEGKSGFGNETDLIFGTKEEQLAANQAFADNYKINLINMMKDEDREGGYAGAGELKLKG